MRVKPATDGRSFRQTEDACESHRTRGQKTRPTDGGGTRAAEDAPDRWRKLTAAEEVLVTSHQAHQVQGLPPGVGIRPASKRARNAGSERGLPGNPGAAVGLTVSDCLGARAAPWGGAVQGGRDSSRSSDFVNNCINSCIVGGFLRVWETFFDLKKFWDRWIDKLWRGCTMSPAAGLSNHPSRIPVMPFDSNGCNSETFLGKNILLRPTRICPSMYTELDWLLSIWCRQMKYT